jgi:hypothetical protein
MRRSDAEFHLTDVRQMSDRVMIDLFKRKINDMNRSSVDNSFREDQPHHGPKQEKSAEALSDCH